MKGQLIILFLICTLAQSTALAGSGERMVKFADIYHDAKTVPGLPGTIKESFGTPTHKTNKTKSSQKPTFWQKIDKLMLKMQNSNN